MPRTLQNVKPQVIHPVVANRTSFQTVGASRLNASFGEGESAPRIANKTGNLQRKRVTIRALDNDVVFCRLLSENPVIAPSAIIQDPFGTAHRIFPNALEPLLTGNSLPIDLIIEAVSDIFFWGGGTTSPPRNNYVCLSEDSYYQDYQEG